MRTIDEIVEHYQRIKDSDWLGFKAEVLLVYLPAKELVPAGEGAGGGHWQARYGAGGLGTG